MNLEETDIVHKVEKKYFQEIIDFERYWYLGERFKYNQFAGYVNAPFKSNTLNIQIVKYSI